jgi:hypothetical protein
MHGLINRSIQRFVSDTYGVTQWEAIARKAGLDFTDFEPMLTYDAAHTPALLNAAADHLSQPRANIMEDLGTYLVTHPDFEAVRRLLRFSGVDFADFLHSLDDLRDRARLAVPDLILPSLELHAHSDQHFTLRCQASMSGYGHVMMGVLRVMADDFGALALLDHQGMQDGIETIAITLVAANYAQGRHFDMGLSAG